MAESKISKTCWTSNDEATLVEAFLEQKRAGNMSENGWKPCAYNTVVTTLNGSEKISGGAVKTLTTVKSQWQQVCVSQACMVKSHCYQLKGEYVEVKKL